MTEFYRRMPLRVIVFILLAAFFTGTALADLEIKTARYGNTTSYRDVSGVVTAFARSNTLSFPVNTRSMRVNPSPHGVNFLYIEYRVGQQDYDDTVRQGDIFTFRGLPAVEPVRALLFLNPPTPQAVPLQIVNHSHHNICIFSVDRFGQWVWLTKMPGGLTLALDGLLGEEWIATDPLYRVIARQHLTHGDNIFVVN
jgi:hypothetical protein